MPYALKDARQPAGEEPLHLTPFTTQHFRAMPRRPELAGIHWFRQRAGVALGVFVRTVEAALRSTRGYGMMRPSVFAGSLARRALRKEQQVV